MSGILWTDKKTEVDIATVKMAHRLSDTKVKEATRRIEDVLITSLDWREVIEVLSREVLYAGIFRSLTISLVHWDQEQIEVVANYLSVDDRGRILPDRRVVESPSYVKRSNGVTRETSPLIGREISFRESDDFTVIAALGGELLVRGFIDYDYGGEKNRRNVKMGYFIPLRCGGRGAAVLATGSSIEEQEEVQRRIDLLEPLFKQVALALEHARMHRSLEIRHGELSEERRRLDSTLEGLSDAVVATNAQGYITQFNRPALDFIGREGEGLESRSLEEALSCSEDPNRLAVCIDRVLSKGVNESTEAMLYKSEIHPRTVLVQGVPVWGEDDSIAGGVFVLRDITDERLLEQMRMRSDRVDAIEHLAGGIAHDFNNLLASTRLNASLLRHDGLDASNHKAIVTDIEASLDRARDMTGQLLTFVRGKETKRERGDLAEVVRNTAGFALRGSDIVHSIEVEATLWAVVMNATEIGQVVHNLIINALQAMPDRGTINTHLENKRVEDGSAIPLPAGDYVRCAIRDSGEGITLEDLRSIFDPYFTTKANGSGLGLFSSYAIINRHDGWLNAESTRGEGAEFYFFLPRAKARNGASKSR